MGKCMMHVVNCAGLCQFGCMLMDVSAIPEFLGMATGWELSLDDLLKTGERIANIRQAFNIREGVGVNDFKVPNRVLGRPPMEAGPLAGVSVDIESARRDYLVAMDWDPETGKPSKRKLEELGLDDVARELWP